MLTNILNFAERHVFTARTLAFLLMVVLIALPFFLFGSPTKQLSSDLGKEARQLFLENILCLLYSCLGILVIILIIFVGNKHIKSKKKGKEV